MSSSDACMANLQRNKLADRLGFNNHNVLVKAHQDREEVMASQGLHKFCEPKKETEML